jgi:uncharacterized protein
MSEALAQFAGQHYLNLETYRKSGKAVQTPMWFVERDGLLYAEAPAQTGKVKRVRNGSAARVVPCDGKGTPKGTWVDASIRIVDGTAAQDAQAMIQRKYGWQYRMLHLFGRLRRWRYAMLEMRVV